MTTDLVAPKAARRARPKEIPLERLASRGLLAPGSPRVNEALARAGKLYAEMFGREKLATDDMLACWFSVDERHRPLLDDVLIEQKMPKEIFRKYCSSKREKTGVASVMHQLTEALRELARYFGFIEQPRQAPSHTQIDAALDDARARWPHIFQGDAAREQWPNAKTDDVVTDERNEAARQLMRLASARAKRAKMGAAIPTPLAVALRLVRT